MKGSAWARERVREAGGDELLERLDHLDGARRGARAPETPPRAPDRTAQVDVDVAIAGGGLWSLLAPMLAARGLRVAVIERARAGAAHREWNASGPELERLVSAGLVTEAELASLVVARYRTGVCRFHEGGTYPVDGVLDHAVDAGGLLEHARALAEARGVTFLDGHTLVGHASGPASVALRLSAAGSSRELVAKIMVDARGAASPSATADLVCPTVGGVMTGLAPGDAPDEMNPDVGEILATIDPIDREGRQHVWEAFPGRAGETTVYMFHYARATDDASLADLFARFFEALPTYKRGDARMLRPTFGFIPGWSRLVPAPRPPAPRVALVGDAAARHSPLTYCGFGATLRSLAPAADAVARAAHDERTDLRCIVDDAKVHTLTGALAHLMASRAFAGDELNRLLDAAFCSLHEMGASPYAALLKDEMTARSFVSFLGRMSSRHPAVWGQAARGMGIGPAARWGFGLVRGLAANA